DHFIGFIARFVAPPAWHFDVAFAIYFFKSFLHFLVWCGPRKVMTWKRSRLRLRFKAPAGRANRYLLRLVFGLPGLQHSRRRVQGEAPPGLRRTGGGGDRKHR